jgi:hypothetical protein
MRTHVLILVGGALAGTFVLLGTVPHGPAVSPDSATYIAAANSFADGRGFVGYSGSPYSEKPPLYPTLLAIGELLGLDVMTTVSVMHAIVFAWLCVLAGWLFHSNLRTPALAWIGFVGVVASWPLLQVAVKVWSEIIFALLAIIFIVQAKTALTRSGWLQVILLAVVASISTMQRYIGLCFVITGILVILFSPSGIDRRRRGTYAMAFSVVAVGPLLLWFVRNLAVDGTLTGGRVITSQLLVSESLAQLVETLTTWVAPPAMPMWLGFVVVAGLAVIAGFGFKSEISEESPVHNRRSGTRMMTQITILFVLVYSLFVVSLSSMEVAALPGTRILSPLYVPLVFLVLVGLDGLAARRNGANKRVIVVVSAVWLVYPVLSTASYLVVRSTYDTNVWHDSALARSLATDPPEGTLFSNQAWVVYLFTERETRRLETSEDIEAILREDANETGKQRLLVWFYGANRGRAHAARFLHDFSDRLAVLGGGSGSDKIASRLLDFMERSGLANKDGESTTLVEPQDSEHMALSLKPIDSLVVRRSFEDGALYLLSDESAADH